MEQKVTHLDFGTPFQIHPEATVWEAVFHHTAVPLSKSYKLGHLSRILICFLGSSECYLNFNHLALFECHMTLSCMHLINFHAFPPNNWSVVCLFHRNMESPGEKFFCLWYFINFLEYISKVKFSNMSPKRSPTSVFSHLISISSVQKGWKVADQPFRAFIVKTASNQEAEVITGMM